MARFQVLFLLAGLLFQISWANPYIRSKREASNPGGKNKHGWKPTASPSARAVYFMTNKAENAIVALHVAPNGTIASVGSVANTDGMGGNLVSPTDLTPNGPDALGSQGSVQVSGNVSFWTVKNRSSKTNPGFFQLLFAVNAGSSTLSMFEISDHDPTNLALVGRPAWTNGDFPVSVAVAPDLRLACVGNTGARSGVSCAHFDPRTGLSQFDELRPIPLGQSTPPTGPAHGIAQVLFSEPDSTLITIVKGNGTVLDTGFVATYQTDARSASVGYESRQISPTGTNLLFGTTTIPGTSKLLASNAGFGSFLLDLNDLDTPVAATNITNGKAPCWSTTSPATGTGFVDDVLVSQSVEVDLSTGAIVSAVDCGNNDQGMVDLKATGDKIYALSPGKGTLPAAVTVFDVSGGRGSQHSIQNYQVSFADKNAQGLAVLY